MNGAESLVHSLLNSGVDTCFSNPGTSEMHFVAALDRVPGMRCVLGLFEGVVTGAADGYARMTGKPAATLLHCGPGLANGLANLHNARRAATPIVNIVGDQATYHRPLDAPLTADTEGWARGVSGWVRTAMDVEDRRPRRRRRGAGRDDRARPDRHADPALRHLLERRRHPGRGAAARAHPPRLAQPDRGMPPPSCAAADPGIVLLLGGEALSATGLALAHRIAAATGCRLMAQGSNAKIARGQGRASLDRVPYVVEVAVKAMAGTKQLMLCGARKPVTFFAYPNKVQTSIPEDAEIHILARPEQDLVEALARLADALHAPKVAAPDNGPRHEVGRGALTPESVASTVGALMPEGAIIADESVTYGRGFFPNTKAAAHHDWLNVTGGAIGGGMPMATGCAIGAPGPAGDQSAGGRIGDVHGAGAVDSGARETRCHDGIVVQPQVPNSDRRTRQCRRQSWAYRHGHARPRQSGYRLAETGQRHGR